MITKLLFTMYILIYSLVFVPSIQALPLPDISAEGAILIEPKTNTILYSKNAYEKFYPASTTKILTCLILIEEMSSHDVLTKSADSVRNVPADSSHIGLFPGDQYSYLDGLHAILMGSDNFVSYDMANLNAGSQEAFVEKMNQKVKNLGLSSSHFANPHGYHEPTHYTTPYDLAQITIAAFDNPTLSKIAGTPNYNFTITNTGKIIPLKNSAALLDQSSPYYNPTVTAVKTGYHTPAGRTLVAQATYNDMKLIGVIMKTEAPNQFIDMNTLLAYGYDNFKFHSPSQGNSYIENISYSTWAKEPIDHALSNAWIPRTTRNYMSSLTINEFITLLQKVVSRDEGPMLYQYDVSNPSATLLANKPLTRQDASYIIYKLGHNPASKSYYLYNTLNIPDLNSAPSYYHDAIQYTVSRNLLGNPNTSFNPSGLLTYEQAINLAYKLEKFFNTTIPYIFY